MKVDRKELIENVKEMFEQLNDNDFYSMYELLWSLGAKDLIIKLNKKESQREVKA